MLIYDPTKAATPDYEPGVLVVRFKPGVSANTAKQLTDGLGLTLVTGPGNSGLAQINVPEGKEDHFAAELAKSDLVQSAERNEVFQIQQFPPDEVAQVVASNNPLVWNPDLKFIEFLRSELKSVLGENMDAPAVGTSTGVLSWNQLIDQIAEGSPDARIIYSRLFNDEEHQSRYKAWLSR